MKKTYSLNHDWRFKKESELKKVELDDYFNMFGSDTKTGIRSDYLGDGWYDGDWKVVSLPHDWAIYEEPASSPDSAQGYLPQGVVIYRKCFMPEEEMCQKRVFIKFDAIAIKSTIYINGIKVAREECGYTPIFVEITPFVEPGRQIVIAVVADSRIKEGWWYEGGGIYGNAYLITAEKSLFANDGIYACPSLIGDDLWEVNVSAEIDGDYKNLRAEFLIDELGVRAQTQFSDFKQAIKFEVNNPKLWDIDEPNLYNMRCLLYDENKLIDEEVVTFGFRTLTFDAKNGCLLNGRSIKLKGVCLHHDHAGVGVAVPYKLHKYRLGKLKKMSANAIRTSHNPQLPEFYKACDELGFLVMNETRHFSASEECLTQLKKFIRRDRNHPSVAMWSLFNEEPLQCTKIGYKMAEKMKETVLAEDNSRPITGGMNGPLEPEGVVASVDIVGFNYLQYGYEPFHEVYPDTPIIGSETGSYMTTRYTAHTDMERRKRCSFENILGPNRYAWSDTPGGTWRYIEDKDYVMGGFYWTGIDYRGECGQFPSIVSSFGAMDLCCFPKENFYMHKAVWDANKSINAVYYRDYKKNGDILINCYTNCSDVNLYIDGEFYSKYQSNCYEPLSVYIEDFSGKAFKVCGEENGKEVCEFITELPMLPYQIKTEISQDVLLSDGEDICVVNVYLTGENGSLVPTADNLVSFDVEGGGTIIGLGNGDNTDITPPKSNSKKMYAGCLQMILQSNGKQEDTKIKIHCEGVGDKLLEVKCSKSTVKEHIASEKARLSVLSWRASDVHKEYPHNNIGDLMFCWIPTTVGYGKNLMYSGKHGFAEIGGKIVVPDIADNEKAELVFEEILGSFDIYLNQELVYSGENNKDLIIPIQTEKYKNDVVVSVVFKLHGEDCGICGKSYVQVI